MNVGGHDWKMLHVTESELYKRAQNIMKKLGKPSALSVAGSSANVGGGALPEVTIPSVSLVFSSELSAGKVIKNFRSCETPIIGRIENDCFMIDLKAIEVADLPYLIDSINKVLSAMTPKPKK